MARVGLLILVLLAGSVAGTLLNMSGAGRTYTVASGSMEPNLPKGALAIIGDEPVDVGDIIVYRSPVGADQVHRVKEIRNVDGDIYYFTQGDANPTSDSFLVPEGDVLGVLQHQIPYLGELWLLPQHIHMALFAACVLAYLAVTFWESRSVLRPRHLVVGLMVGLVVTAPLALAQVGIAYPEATGTIDVAGPSPLAMAAGTAGQASIDADTNGATVTLSENPAPLWKEILLWHCKASDETTAGCTHAPGGTSYAQVQSTLFKLGSYAPDPTFYLEAEMAAPSGGSISVILHDKTAATDVTGSEITTADTGGVVVRSGGFSATEGDNFLIRTKQSVAGGGITMVRLLVRQDNPTTTETMIPISGGGREDVDAYTTVARSGRWVYDAANWDGVTAIEWHAVLSASGKGFTARLLRTNDAVAVATFKDIEDITVVNTADVTVSLADGNELEIEMKKKNTGDGLHHNSFIVIKQTTFTKTIRYASLANTDETAATSYTTVGHPGRLHGGDEWTTNTAHLEVTLDNDQVGGTTYGQLRDSATGVITGSETSAAGTAHARVRSGALSLPGTNTTYTVEAKASSGSTATVRAAWLMILQNQPSGGGGPLYDHVLETDPTDAACSWTFRLEYVSDSNLARIDYMNISYDGDGPAGQIKVVSGSVTQTTGSALAVGTGVLLKHIVEVTTTGAGTTTLDADVRGVCGGIQTWQRVVYRVT